MRRGAEERQRKEDDGWKGTKREEEKKDAEVSKMENLSSLGSQQSAELNLTRKMTLHPLSYQSD